MLKLFSTFFGKLMQFAHGSTPLELTNGGTWALSALAGAPAHFARTQHQYPWMVDIASAFTVGYGTKICSWLLRKTDIDCTRRAEELTEGEVEHVITIMQNPSSVLGQKDMKDRKYSQYLPKRNKDLRVKVLHSFICNSPKLEITQMAINKKILQAAVAAACSAAAAFAATVPAPTRHCRLPRSAPFYLAPPRLGFPSGSHLAFRFSSLFILSCLQSSLLPLSASGAATAWMGSVWTNWDQMRPPLSSESLVLVLSPANSPSLTLDSLSPKQLLLRSSSLVSTTVEWKRDSHSAEYSESLAT
ncbi:LOW QUALITY PROTEIN: hypothetical protein QTO34_019929 [Cnephaeus nilssonii]|uniref:Uncharacterized protein n=1 Tax=Cnephaeus nilssonii TaxID=3371016 RepID=A0AA40HXP4_CNENI|nr:LOW QUALITY PROTEIN: hypothetical protein QTO34_019929 [Eptesicus nilssonii]